MIEGAISVVLVDVNRATALGTLGSTRNFRQGLNRLLLGLNPDSPRLVVWQMSAVALHCHR